MSTFTLPLTVEALRAQYAAGARPTFRYFWGHKKPAHSALSDSVFSQWWEAEFRDADGTRYANAEQYMMAGKARLMGDAETLAAILAIDDPSKVKALGRKVKPYDDARWEAHRFDVVTAGNVAKFSASPAMRAYLLSTERDILVEASPTDTIWGIGLGAADERARDPHEWRGRNLLGFALVRARAILREELPPVVIR